jgi:hypothetical protein
MKYIKLFEDFTDKFDHKLIDIKEVLTKRGTIFNNISYIKSGAYGSVFEIDNNIILKLTNMKSEVYYANKIKNIESDNIIKIFDVFFHKYTDVGYNVNVGFILMEKLDVDRVPKAFKTFVDYLNQRNPLINIWKEVSDKKVIDFFKDKLISITDNDIINYWNSYKKILSECERYNIPTDDLRGDNIGMRGNNFVFFDIGDLYNSYDHDYTNIDFIDKQINNL